MEVSLGQRVSSRPSWAVYGDPGEKGKGRRGWGVLRALEYPELRMSTNEVPEFVLKIYFYLCVCLYVGLCTFLQSPGVQGG